jgi:uncharacterized phage protein (TIGR02216 family)
VLRLPPATFWSLTPRELAAALVPLAGAQKSEPPPRAELARLMHSYPDKQK